MKQSRITKPNYILWNRNSVVIKRHLPVVLKPLIISTVASLTWLLLIHSNDIHFSDKSIEPILFIVLPLLGFMYVIFASIAVGSVFDQYKIISKCVVKKDVDTFLLYRDEQLPIMMHILIGAPTVFIVLFVSLFNYQGDVLAGVASIFAVTFMLVLGWVIATELDDFSKSIWFREKIPKSWYEIEVEKHFKSKSEK